MDRWGASLGWLTGAVIIASPPRQGEEARHPGTLDLRKAGSSERGRISLQAPAFP